MYSQIKKINKIGLVVNQLKSEAIKLVPEIKSLLDKYSIDCIYSPDLYMNESNVSYFKDADMIMVLGGDGTLLNVARISGKCNIPILGVNFGTLGFIAEIEPQDYKAAIESVAAGEYFISERIVLEATIYKANGDINIYYGLNDVVISKGGNARMLSIDAFVNDSFLVNYNADGIIIAGPTGSTAYNLSAGGPVIHPEVRALVLTPICPHTIGERPLVIPHYETIKICFSENKEQQHGVFSMDGQINVDFSSDDYVVIKVADYTIKFVELSQSNFYHKLRSRLSWGN